MDDNEKLTALKKAYADIILNTAKEAAARIMVSERKSIRFQQELFAAKEESLHLLLRVKQMMDSKINEAEMTSLSQQQKIEELEAQLHEAEDIVQELRVELREVRYEMEKVNANHSRLDEPILKDYTANQEEKSPENRLIMSPSIICPPLDSRPEPVITSDVKDPTLNRRNEGNKCQSTNESRSENRYVGSTDFSSIMMINKEPELLRNGCTQRIRAFERNLLDGNLSLSGEVDGVKNVAIVREDEKDEGTHIRPILNADICCSLEKDPHELRKVKQADNGSYRVQVNKPRGKIRSLLRCKRKRTTAPSYAHVSNQAMEINQTSDLFSSKTSSFPVNTNAQSEENPYKINNNDAQIYPGSHEKADGTQTRPVLSADTSCTVEKEPDKLKKVHADNGSDKVQYYRFLCRKARKLVNRKRAKALLSTHQVMEMCQASDLSSSKTSTFPVHNNVQSGENPSNDNEAHRDPKSHLAPSYTAEMKTKSGCVDVTESKLEFVESCSTPQLANNGHELIDKLELTRQESGSAETSGALVRKMDLETVNAQSNSDVKTTDATTNGGPSQHTNDRIIKYTFRRKRKKESLSSNDGGASLEESSLKRKKEEELHDSSEPQKSSSIIEST